MAVESSKVDLSGRRRTERASMQKARSLTQLKADYLRRADALTLDDRRRGGKRSASLQTRNAAGRFTERKP